MSNNNDDPELDDLIRISLSNISEQHQDDVVVSALLQRKETTRNKDDDHVARHVDHILESKYREHHDNLVAYEPLNIYYISCSSPTNVNAKNNTLSCQQEKCMNRTEEEQNSSSFALSQQHFISNFEQRNTRKKKTKQYLATTLGFPYKQLLNRDSKDNVEAGPRLFQHYDDDDDRVQFLEKYYRSQWQLEFLKEFYVQGSSCKSSDKYLEYIYNDAEFEEQKMNEHQLLQKQELRSLQEKQREYDSGFPLYHFWNNNDREQYCFTRQPSKTQRDELIFAFDDFVKEANKLMTFMDDSDLSRNKVMSFEKEMNINREKILQQQG